jgi:hypothetical protein
MVAPLNGELSNPEFEEYTYIIRVKTFIIEDENIILEGTIYKNRKKRVHNTLTLLIKNVNTSQFAPAFDFTKYIRKRFYKSQLIY